MSEAKFDWDDLRLFLSVARLGGLAAASEATGKSAPTLGRRMLSLEQQLGQDLFERLPRGYELTDDGQRLLKTASKLENDINPLLSVVNGARVRRVKISAGTWVTYLLSQHVAELIVHQSVIVQFIAADHVLDIAHREVIIGIRNQRPTQISLAGRRTRKIQFAVYAVNKNIDTWARVVGPTPSARWVREHADNEPFIEVSHPRNALDMALAGAVKTVLPTFIGDATKGIERVSQPIEALEHMQWLVTHHEERHTPEVRLVIDWMQKVLGVDNN